MKIAPIPAPIETAPNPSYVSLLTEVLTRLWDGVRERSERYERYICFIIDELTDNEGVFEINDEWRAAGVNLKREICFRLGRPLNMNYSISYECWLNKQNVGRYDTFTNEELQSARKAFVLQMIKEFGG